MMQFLSSTNNVWLLAAGLTIASCSSKKSPAEAPPVAKTQMGAGAATPPAVPQPADVPAGPMALDQKLTIAGLGLTLQAPACVQLKVSDGGPGDRPPNALLQPKDPDCRAFGLMGVSIRDAKSDFGPGDAAKKAVTSYFQGRNIVMTENADGYRLTYQFGDADAPKGLGLVIARRIGSRTINCRGQGDAAELQTIEAVCASLASSPP